MKPEKQGEMKLDKIRKVVIPAAGLGTRFLPATKASPKEMLTIVDKPLIQYAAEEAVEAGMTELVFVIGRNKGVIAEHFDKSYELERDLHKHNKIDLLECISKIIPPEVSCSYIRQAEALGLGHAVLCASSIVCDQPFAVLLPDDLVKSNGTGCLAQMIEEYEKCQKAIVAVQPIPQEQSVRYGIIDPGERVGRIWKVKDIVEKPRPEKAPSNLGVVGRYIFPGKILSILRRLGAGMGNEIQLTDAIAAIASQGEVNAYEFIGARYDCGSKLGFIQANIAYGIDHSEIGSDLKGWLSDRFT